MQGKFRGWIVGKPFGFISPEDGSVDVFLHESEVRAPTQLSPSSILQFDVVSTTKGPQAKNVEIISLASPSAQEEVPPVATSVEGKLKFWLDAGYGFIDTHSYGEVFVHYRGLTLSQDGYLSDGDIVKLDVFQGAKGYEGRNVEVIGWEPTGSPLARFADMGNPRWLARLGEAGRGLAEDEDWFYRHAKSPSQFPILRSYIYNTFHRLQEMDKGLRFTPDGRLASFNTGLVTPNQEEIYGVFIKNPVGGRQPWKMRSFYKASDREFLNYFGKDPPPLAEYFHETKDLLFDRNCQLYVVIDHVLERIERFPESLRDNPYMARQLLQAAEVQMKKRVYRNYKTAIPQYYRDGGGKGALQLLLPLCLLSPSRADLALTVEKMDSGDAYRGSTVLTLDMAYNNARLLARPDTEWLQP